MIPVHDSISPKFIGRWARGIRLAQKRLARAGYTPPADLVLDVLGEDFLNPITMEKAVALAKPDPLSVA